MGCCETGHSDHADAPATRCAESSGGSAASVSGAAGSSAGSGSGSGSGRRAEPPIIASISSMPSFPAAAGATFFSGLACASPFFAGLLCSSREEEGCVSREEEQALPPPPPLPWAWAEWPTTTGTPCRPPPPLRFFFFLSGCDCCCDCGCGCGCGWGAVLPRSRRGADQAAARAAPDPSPVGLADTSSRLRFFCLRGGCCGGGCGGCCSDGAVASRLGRACFASGAARFFIAAASFVEGGSGRPLRLTF